MVEDHTTKTNAEPLDRGAILPSMTIAPTWRPLSARTAAPQPDRAPVALRQDLRDWIHSAATKQPLIKRATSRLNIKFELGPETEFRKYYLDRLRYGFAYCTPDRRVLDMVDAVLDLLPPSKNPQQIGPLLRALYTDHRAKLTQVLADANSIYEVSADGRGLVRRASAWSAATYRGAVAAASASPQFGSAHEHLRSAWDAIHGRHTDPSKAYSEAIKAVEAAAHATVEPSNQLATLGTMLARLRSDPSRFALAIPGPSGIGEITPLIELIKMLWKGQTSRHGAQTATRPETIEEARMAVSTAITLVEWFATGAVTAQR
jgi:hypothetical protein